jgi:hypothetical protein
VNIIYCDVFQSTQVHTNIIYVWMLVAVCMLCVHACANTKLMSYVCVCVCVCVSVGVLVMVCVCVCVLVGVFIHMSVYNIRNLQVKCSTV